jgi:hypothetical protein
MLGSVSGLVKKLFTTEEAIAPLKYLEGKSLGFKE